MKRIISILFVAIFCFAICPVSYSQLKVKSQASKPIELGIIRMSYSKLIYWKDHYALKIGGNTSIPGLIFGLGDSKESATLTLRDLLSTIEGLNVSDQMDVEDSYGIATQLHIRSMLGEKYLSLERIDSRNHAYDERISVNITGPEIEKAIKKLAEVVVQ